LAMRYLSAAHANPLGCNDATPEAEGIVGSHARSPIRRQDGLERTATLQRVSR
jgi:hypothetical protein